jgi:hypothetical protein
MARLIVLSHRGRIDLVERARGTRFEVVVPGIAAGVALEAKGA